MPQSVGPPGMAETPVHAAGSHGDSPHTPCATSSVLRPEPPAPPITSDTAPNNGARCWPTQTSSVPPTRSMVRLTGATPDALARVGSAGRTWLRFCRGRIPCHALAERRGVLLPPPGAPAAETGRGAEVHAELEEAGGRCPLAPDLGGAPPPPRSARSPSGYARAGCYGISSQPSERHPASGSPAH